MYILSDNFKKTDLKKIIKCFNIKQLQQIYRHITSEEEFINDDEKYLKDDEFYRFILNEMYNDKKILNRFMKSCFHHKFNRNIDELKDISDLRFTEENRNCFITFAHAFSVYENIMREKENKYDVLDFDQFKKSELKELLLSLNFFKTVEFRAELSDDIINTNKLLQCYKNNRQKISTQFLCTHLAKLCYENSNLKHTVRLFIKENLFIMLDLNNNDSREVIKQFSSDNEYVRRFLSYNHISYDDNMLSIIEESKKLAELEDSVDQLTTQNNQLKKQVKEFQERIKYLDDANVNLLNELSTKKKATLLMEKKLNNLKVSTKEKEKILSIIQKSETHNELLDYIQNQKNKLFINKLDLSEFVEKYNQMIMIEYIFINIMGENK